MFDRMEKTIGQTLREARKAARYSGAEIARACGVSKAAVCDWEMGRTVPTKEHIARIPEPIREPVVRAAIMEVIVDSDAVLSEYRAMLGED
jgi:transcriptional regulator with XRE-family HTH domain